MAELRAFLVAADELHFGRAAERLRISPSRVSQLVRGLETRVGAPLFERTTRRVELTPIGAHLYADLTRV
jgi:DNA-binding transcriptional LysR family regulator